MAKHIHVHLRDGTASQEAALRKLRQLQAQGFPNRTKLGNIITGINTTTLHNLGAEKKIKCSTVWLRGICSPDLKVRDADRVYKVGERVYVKYDTEQAATVVAYLGRDRYRLKLSVGGHGSKPGTIVDMDSDEFIGGEF